MKDDPNSMLFNLIRPILRKITRNPEVSFQQTQFSFTTLSLPNNARPLTLINRPIAPNKKHPLFSTEIHRSEPTNKKNTVRFYGQFTPLTKTYPF